MARTWFENGYVAFDTETTGVQEKEDRIISASLLYYSPTHALVKRRTWLINPGIEVPAAATAAGRLQKIRLCCASVPRQLSPVLDLPPYATI